MFVHVDVDVLSNVLISNFRSWSVCDHAFNRRFVG